MYGVTKTGVCVKIPKLIYIWANIVPSVQNIRILTHSWNEGAALVGGGSTMVSSLGKDDFHAHGRFFLGSFFWFSFLWCTLQHFSILQSAMSHGHIKNGQKKLPKKKKNIS